MTSQQPDDSIAHNLTQSDQADQADQFSFAKSDLTAANLSRMVAQDANFSEADLTDAVIDDALLLGRPNFTRATIAGTSFQNSTLTDAKFIGARIATDFAGTDLTRADFSGAHIIGTNFTGALLGGAGFRGATLDGVRFSGCDLSHVDFTGVTWVAASDDHQPDLNEE